MNWRYVKIAGITVGAIVAALVLVVVALVAGLFSQSTARLALGVAGDAAGYTIECESFEGNIFSEFVCGGLTVADGEGVFLSAAQLDVAWHFFGALTGTVDVDHIRVADAELVRQPEPAEPPPAVEPPSLPNWPSIDISVGELAVQRFVVALPDAPMICVNGMASTVVAEPVLTLNAQFSRCAVEGTVMADVRLDGDQLALDVQASDDGDVAALLLGWEGAGETELRLVGSGPLTSFSGRLDAFIVNGGNASLDITTLAAGENEIGGLDIDGQVTLAEGRAPEWAPATEGSVAAQIYFGDEGGMRIENGNIEWGNAGILFALNRTGEGTMNGRVVADIGAYDGAVAFASAEFDLTVQGTAETQTVNGSYALNGFCADEICAEQIAGQIEATNEDGMLAAVTQGNADSLRVSEAVNELIGAQTVFDITANYDVDESTIDLEGTLDGAQAGVTLDGQVILADGTRGSGSVQIELEESAVIGGTALPAAVTLNAEIAEFTVGGGVAGTLDLTSTMLAASGEFALSADQTVDASFATTNADAEQLSALAGVQFTGAPSFSGTVSGSLDAPVISADAMIPELSTGGITLTGAEWRVDTRSADGVWSGESLLTSESTAGAIALNANFARGENEPLRITIADSHIAEADIAGEVVIPQNDAPMSGMFTIDGNVMAPVGNYLGQPASSEGAITLDIKGEEGVTVLTAGIALDEVHFGEDLDGASVNGALDYNLETQMADGTLTIGTEDNTVTVAAAAQMGDMTVVTLRTLEGSFADTPIRLADTATLRIAGGTTTLDETVLAIGDGSANVSFMQGAESLQADITLADIPVALLMTLQGFPEAQGSISATLNARMTETTSEGGFELTLDEFAFTEIARDVDPADLAMRGDWNGQELTIDGEIAGLYDTPATLTASIPLRRTGVGFGAAVQDDAPIMASFNGTARAERFLALLPIAEHNLAGLISISIELMGTPENPDFTGQARLQDATYESLEFGTRMEDLDATLDARADGAFAFEMNATDGDDGTIAASGTLSFDENAQPVGDASVTINNSYLIRRDDVIARGSGNLTVELPENMPISVNGMFRTAEVRIDLGQPLPASVQEIDVIEINRPPELGAIGEEPPADDAAPARQIDLDLSIVMPNNVRVEGYGVNAEWQGNLNVGGTAETPRITGEITLVRGFAEFLGRAFVLEEGSIVPDPNAAGNARVDITGTHTQDELNVEISIQGPAASPEIEWTSTPMLPRDEIISRLYFGRSSPQLSAYEAIQLAQLSGALGGIGGGGGGVLDFARNMAGLDVLRIEPPESGDITNPTITVGKYVTDRVYVGARRDADTSSSAIEVEVDITPNISAQIETGTDDNQAASVNWQWDY